MKAHHIGIGVGLAILVIALVAVIGLVVVQNVQNRQMAQQALAVSTASALATASAPTATPIPPPTVPPTATTVDLSAGYSIRVESLPASIIADGRTELTLVVEVNNPELVGDRVFFSPRGGGYVEPSEAVLPAVGQPLRVTYTTGSSTSEIRVEAIVNHDGRNLTQSTEFAVEGEDIALHVTYSEPTDTGIPFNVRLVTGNDNAISGTYIVELDSVQGNGDFIDNTGQPVDEVTLNPNTPFAALQYVPYRGDKDVISVEVFGKPEINFRDTIYWDGIATSISINRPDNYTPDTPMFWAPGVENNGLCVYTERLGVGTVAPRMLRMQYDTLLAFDPTEPRFSLSERPISPSTPVTSEDSGYNMEPLFSLNVGRSCFVPTFPEGTLGGLIDVTLQPTLPVYSDTQRVLIHMGRLAAVAPNTTLSLSSGGTTVATAPLLSPADAPALYRMHPQDRTRALAVMWVENQYADRANQRLNVVAGTQLYLVPRSQQPYNVTPILGASGDVYTVDDVYIPAHTATTLEELVLVYALVGISPEPPRPTPVVAPAVEPLEPPPVTPPS